MIIQTAPAGTPRLAIMMYEHTALCLHFAHAFGNERFEPLNPLELMIHVISHHDAGWFDFDRDPQIDPATHLPYNLAETPPAFITETSRGSPEFNQRQHAYCGLISSMHSWGLYNGRYGLSKVVLLDKVAAKDRPLADKMLNGELERQKRSEQNVLKTRKRVPGSASTRFSRTTKRCNSSIHSPSISTGSTRPSASNKTSKTCRCRMRRT